MSDSTSTVATPRAFPLRGLFGIVAAAAGLSLLGWYVGREGLASVAMLGLWLTIAAGFMCAGRSSGAICSWE